MAASREAFLERRKQELFGHLRDGHDALTDYQDQHNATEFGCVRSGKCCQVGLQLHMVECEHIANNIRAMCAGDDELFESMVEKLEHALEDEGWSWAESVGDHMCAFFEDGCTIYPFRPSVCRAYGVVLEVDEFCPRKRTPEGEAFVFAQKETDRQMSDIYRTFDNYGRLFPKLDYTMYMPSGVLTFLLPAKRLAALKAKTPKKFWRRQKGYRMQYEPSYKMPEKKRTNVKFEFAEQYFEKRRAQTKG